MIDPQENLKAENRSLVRRLLILAVGFKLYYLTVVLLRIKSELIAARLRALDLAVVKGS